MKLIDEIVEVMREYTDAPDSYLYATAFHVVSSTLGWAVYCPYLPRPSRYQARPNLWIMLSGMPGITRKSTVVGACEYLIRESFKEAWRQQNPNLTPSELNKMASLLFIESGSPEGIIDHIADSWGAVPVYVILSSEYGGVLLGMKSRDYMIGMMNLLSKLYYGEGGRMSLSKRGKGKKDRILPSGAYVTMMVCIQEPHLYIDPDMLNQGLMRRIMLIYVKPEDKDRWKPPLDLGREMIQDKFDEIIQEIATLINEYNELQSSGPVLTVFDHDVINEINEYAKLCETMAVKEPGAWSMYKQTWWEHLTKLSIINAISSRKPRSGLGGYVIDVKEHDVKKAMKFLEMIEPRTREAISNIVARIVRRPVQQVVGGLEMVYSIITSAGKDGINARELLRRSGMSKKELKEYVINLVEQGRVIAIKARSKSRGRKPIVFFDSKYEVIAVQKGDTISAQALNVIW